MQISGDALHQRVVRQYAEFVNPYLARLMSFAGFGVEVRAEGCHIWDHEGRQYLDFLGGYGVFSLGHRHPKVVEAVKRQMDQMPLSGKTFFCAAAGELAERLADISPGDLRFTFFSNSGTEAVEAALKFAKGATGRPHIVSTEGGYHGKTIGALSVTGREKYRKKFEPLMPGARFVPYGDTAAMELAIDDSVAAVIIETIQGEGGIHIAPSGYLAAIRRRCDAVGALMIVDEVQTGIGRTGLWFGCDHDGIRPDILTMAKALGGGIMPIGATMGTPAVWDAIFSENPLLHTSTFGGNPLACTAGIITLQVIEDEGLVERSRILGERLLAGLEGVKQRHPDLVSGVRGKGLITGIEFTMDDVGELVIAQMVKRGVVAAYTLNNRRVIRLEPALIVTEAMIDQAVDVVTEAVAETGDLIAALL
ncbi:MAG: Putrescine aminotransferase [Fimbriimonadaceae bacterium]|nr:Putrescine aminotransferase [Fimbriimonadaceae bacterium]